MQRKPVRSQLWRSGFSCRQPPSRGAGGRDALVRRGNTFFPETVTVNLGDSVTWTNAGGFHNVHFDDDSFDEPPFVQLPPWTVSRTFAEEGSFGYYCEAHGAVGGIGMAGAVDVIAPDPDTGGPGASTEAGQAQGQAGPVSGQGAAASCTSKRSFRIRLRGLDGVRVRAVRVSLNGKQVRVRVRSVDGRPRHTAQIDMRGLRQGAYTVTIAVTTAGGAILRGTRTYRTCAGKLASSGLPRL